MTTKENQHYIARETILSMVHWFVEFVTGVSKIFRASSMNFKIPAKVSCKQVGIKRKNFKIL